MRSDAALLCAGAGQGGLRQQLRAMSRRGRDRRDRLSELERRRLVVGRHTGGDPGDHCVWRAFRQRQGAPNAMPAFGKSGILKPDEIVAVASHVRSLSGLAVRPGVDVAKGKAVFADSCASCHCEDAKGNQDLGAPNLADRIWLCGSDEAAVIDTIANGRAGVMPAWTDRLDPGTINALAVYVHMLGGGKCCCSCRFAASRRRACRDGARPGGVGRPAGRRDRHPTSGRHAQRVATVSCRPFGESKPSGAEASWRTARASRK